MALKLIDAGAVPAGQRRTRVVVQVAVDAAANASGEVVPDFTQVSYVRYAKEMLTSGREFQYAMQTVAMLQGILKLPYDSRTKDLTARDRVVIGDRILNFAAPPIDEEGKHQTITIWVVEPE